MSDYFQFRAEWDALSDEERQQNEGALEEAKRHVRSGGLELDSFGRIFCNGMMLCNDALFILNRPRPCPCSIQSFSVVPGEVVAVLCSPHPRPAAVFDRRREGAVP